MPNIIIEAGSISKETRDELMVSLTRKASEITKIPEKSFTVLMKEFPIENWCIGGVLLEDLVKKK